MDLNNLEVYITENRLQKRIEQVAKEIDKDYIGEELIVISVLKGAVFFTVDLLKNMKTELILDFIQVSSYVGTKSTNKLTIKKDIEENISGKNVLLVEDIIDTGKTLKELKKYLLTKNPKSIKIAVLADKPGRREVEIEADYTGFSIDNKFVVGYGFDYDQKKRNSKEVYHSKDED